MKKLKVNKNDFKFNKDSEPAKEPQSELFEVIGAGHVKLGTDCHALCGPASGFAIGVSWGRHGYSGGVIGRTEAIRLANFILSKCEGVTETEEEENKRRYAEMDAEKGIEI